MDNNESPENVLGEEAAKEVRDQYEVEVAKEIAIPATYLSQLLPDMYNFVAAQARAGNVKEFNAKAYTLELNLTLTEPTDDPATNAVISIADQVLAILRECCPDINIKQISGTRLEQVTAALAELWNSGFQQALYAGAAGSDTSPTIFTTYPVIENYEVIEDFLAQTSLRAAKAMVQHGYTPDPKDFS